MVVLVASLLIRLNLLHVTLLPEPNIPQNLRGVPKKAEELDIAWTVSIKCQVPC